MFKMNFNKKIILVLVLTIVFSVFSTDASFAKKKKKKNLEPVFIEYQAEDGFFLTGIIDIPERASLKNRVPLVIFLHSLGATHQEWMDYPAKIKKLGYATLNLDLRGHGQSVFDENLKRKSWQNFKKSDYDKMSTDIISAIKYLEEEFLEVDTSNISIIASSIGVNASIFAASKMKKEVKTLVLLSPVLYYKGLDSRIALVEYGPHPVMFFVTKEDKYAYDATLELVKYSQGERNVQIYRKAGSGVNILKFEPKTQVMIMDWLIKHTYNIEELEVELH